MKKLPLLIAGASLLAFAPAANAAVTIGGGTTVTTTVDQAADGSFKIGFSDGNLLNPFDEILEFMTTLGGFLSVTATTTANFAGGPNDTDFTNVSLTNTASGGATTDIPATAFSTDQNEFRQVNNVPISAGTYRIRLQGTPGTSNGAFGGDVAFTAASAVPEPGTWLMMLVGFGLLGGALRRKKQTTGARINFA